ncbi:hypothetical protein BH23BAC2_BH23BAC2_16190 [soil metagenome]
MRFTIYFSLLLLSFQFAPAQEIGAKILDAQSRQPVPYATIQYGPNKGVITNDEGRFSLLDHKTKIDTIIISSMGYTTRKLHVKEIKEETIFLKTSSIELKNIFLTNKNLSAKEIVKKVKDQVNTNYNFDLTHKKFFLRESNVNHIRRFDLLVDKSTFAGLDQKLMTQISENIPKYNDSYKEVLGDFYGNYNKQKLLITKAANLHNPQSTAGLNELQPGWREYLKTILRTIPF